MTDPIHVIGGGLAGAEAAHQIAPRGVPVVLHEMRPVRSTPRTRRIVGRAGVFEFVSLRRRRANAVGLLHYELRRLGSVIMAAGDANQVPAGGALAVDREGFAAAVTAAIARESADRDPAGGSGVPPADWDSVIIATGPLTSPALAIAYRRAPAPMRSPSSTPSHPSCIGN